MTKRIELPELEVKLEMLAGITCVRIRGDRYHFSGDYRPESDAHGKAQEIARRCNNWEKVREKLHTAIELSIAGFDNRAVGLAEQALQIMEGEE